MKLLALSGEYCVCRLRSDQPVPSWVWNSAFCSVTRSPDELSVVCQQDTVPFEVIREPGWRCWKLQGPIPFSAAGVVRSLAEPLGAAGIPIFIISTYDTDYLLVKQKHETSARRALLAAGHDVEQS